MYVMLKKTGTINEDSDFFIMERNYLLPCNSKCVFVNISYRNPIVNCCSNLTVFSEDNSSEASFSCDDDINLQLNDSFWYLGKLRFRGFNDYVVNKFSASNMW